MNLTQRIIAGLRTQIQWAIAAGQYDQVAELEAEIKRTEAEAGAEHKTRND